MADASAWDKEGGAAFPIAESDKYHQEWGMSLRDYFAGQALMGMAIAWGQEPVGSPALPDVCAKSAYELADAMLAERAKPFGAK